MLFLQEAHLRLIYKRKYKSEGELSLMYVNFTLNSPGFCLMIPRLCLNMKQYDTG